MLTGSAAAQWKRPVITSTSLATRARVSGLDDSEFQRVAAGAERNCPVSKALAAVSSIRLDAKLAD
jgi:lipoyl-dependent peroxiredoxin